MGYSKEYYQKNKEKINQKMNEWREKHPSKIKKYQEKYRKKNLEKIREMGRKANKKFRENHPEDKEKQRIRRNVRFLFNRRNIIKPCEICNTYTNVIIHHQDYSNPSDILWLCHKHHMQLHKLLKIYKD